MTFEKSVSAPARIAALALALTAGFAASDARAHDGHLHGEAKAADESATKADGHSGHSDHQAKTGHETHSSGHATEPGQMDHAGHSSGHGTEPGQMDHAGHHAQGAADHRMPDHLGMDEGNSERAMRPDGFQYKRGHHAYAAPAVTLRDQHGRKVIFDKLLEFDGPVLLNFIFTSCATICPVQSATFGQAQQDLAAIEPDYRMVSVSIDPEYDTPSRLRDYAELHGAGENWVMLTGQFDDIFQIVRAFDAVYKGENKMYHRPLTFLRANRDAPWLRIEGLLGAEELVGEYGHLVKPEVN